MVAQSHCAEQAVFLLIQEIAMRKGETYVPPQQVIDLVTAIYRFFSLNSIGCFSLMALLMVSFAWEGFASASCLDGRVVLPSGGKQFTDPIEALALEKFGFCSGMLRVPNIT